MASAERPLRVTPFLSASISIVLVDNRFLGAVVMPSAERLLARRASSQGVTEVVRMDRIKLAAGGRNSLTCA